ncbi:MAG: hypothetical protein D3910_18665 [Candidatus Electrothrix sp. ATG2]|nr:hypothetical protein [Candidatus Electrothrix sp. ATG2]
MHYIDLATLHTIVDIVTPLVKTENSRRDFVVRALAYRPDIVSRIQWNGTGELFLLKLLQLLMEDAVSIKSSKAITEFLLAAIAKSESIYHSRIYQIIHTLSSSFTYESIETFDAAPINLTVFLGSPSDVSDERQLARKAIADLPYDPLLRDKVYKNVTFSNIRCVFQLLFRTRRQLS